MVVRTVHPPRPTKNLKEVKKAKEQAKKDAEAAAEKIAAVKRIEEIEEEAAPVLNTVTVLLNQASKEYLKFRWNGSTLNRKHYIHNKQVAVNLKNILDNLLELDRTELNEFRNRI